MKLGLYFTTALLSGAAYLLSLYATAEMGVRFIVAPPAFTEVTARTSLDGGAQSVLLFLVLFATATAFLLLLFRMYRGRLLYRLLFSLVAFLGLLKLFETVFPLEFSALGAAIFLIGLFIIPTVWTHDIIIILASAGVGPVLALNFSEQAAVALLLFLSLYDIIAVVFTQHMMTLAHAMIRNKATFALFVPERLKGFGANIATVRPGAGFLILGGGDLILPMVYLSVIARDSMVAAAVGVCGALAGQLLNHFFLVTTRRPIPALPLISAGMVLGVMAGRTLL